MAIYIGYFGSNGPQGIYALNPNGSVRPRWPVIGTTGSYAPTIGPDGTIFAVSCHNLLALNPDGSAKWPTPFNVVGGSLIQSSIPVEQSM